MSNKAHCIHKQSKQRRKHINKILCIIYSHLRLFIYICTYNNYTPPGLVGVVGWPWYKSNTPTGLMRYVSGWLWYNNYTPAGLAQARRADMIVGEWTRWRKTPKRWNDKVSITQYHPSEVGSVMIAHRDTIISPLRGWWVLLADRVTIISPLRG